VTVGTGGRNGGAVVWSLAAAAVSVGVLFMAFRHMDIGRLPGVLKKRGMG